MTVESRKPSAALAGGLRPRMHISPHLGNWVLRIAIVLGVLASATGMGILGGVLARRNYGFVAFAPAVIPLAILSVELILRRHSVGPLLILICAAFLPLKIPTGSGSPLVGSLLLTMILVGLWLLRMLAVEKRFRLQPSPVNIPLLGFMATTVVALFWSNLLVDPLVKWRGFSPVAIGSTVVMIMLPATFLLVANYVNNEKMLKAMVWVMCLAGVAGAIGQYARVGWLPINTGGMFQMWVVALSVGLALFYTRLAWWQRLALLILAGVWVWWGFGLHFSWLAGWLPILVAAGILVFLRSKALAVIAVLALAVLFIVQANRYTVALEEENKVSGDTRLAAWKMNWRVTGQHLLFGTGPAGYADYYMSYFPDDAMATHSNYIDVLAQTGIVGFTFYVLFFIILAWRGFRLCQRLKGRGDFPEALANAAFAGTIGCIVIMGFGDWLLPFAYTQTIAGFDYAVYNWLFMGTIIVLERLTKHDDTIPVAHA